MITLVLDIITTAAILFVVAAGLLIVFGVMKIINFAHGVLHHRRRLFRARGLAVSGCRRCWPRSLAFLAGGLLGRCRPSASWCARSMRRPLDAILATWGLGIVIGQLITLAFGREVQFVPTPDLRHGDDPGRRLFALPPACWSRRCHRRLLFAGLLNGTRLGLSTRAVIMNETLAQGSASTARGCA